VPPFGVAPGFALPGATPPLGAGAGAAGDLGDSGGLTPGGEEFDGGVRDGVVVEGEAVEGADDVDGCADDGEEPPPLDCASAPAAAARARAAATAIECKLSIRTVPLVKMHGTLASQVPRVARGSGLEARDREQARRERVAFLRKQCAQESEGVALSMSTPKSAVPGAGHLHV
jgi:hypothetical protein